MFQTTNHLCWFRFSPFLAVRSIPINRIHPRYVLCEPRPQSTWLSNGDVTAGTVVVVVAVLGG